MYMASAHGTIVQSILHYKNWSHSPLYVFRFFQHIKTPHLSDRILSDKWGAVHSPLPEQQFHAASVHVEMASSCIVLHVCVLSALRHSYRGLSCFLMIRSRTFFDGSKGFVLFSKEYKKIRTLLLLRKCSDFHCLVRVVIQHFLKTIVVQFVFEVIG